MFQTGGSDGKESTCCVGDLSSIPCKLQSKFVLIELLFAVAKLCLPLCNPLGCTPGFPFLHYLPEFAQAYVH